MAILEIPARRLILAGGFALAVAAAPAVAAFAVPTTGPASLACPGGEEEDLYTGTCLPHTVPNSPAPPSASGPISGIPGNPDLPAVNIPGGGGAIPCTGANAGQCIGLAEEGAAEGPPAEASSTVGSSPTATGSIG